MVFKAVNIDGCLQENIYLMIFAEKWSIIIVPDILLLETATQRDMMG
jgi:hypothetical protein